MGRIYKGKVERIVDFGAFVNILPGKDGLLHISQIAEERVENVTDYLSEGQEVEVVVLDVDQRGRIKLSIKELENYQKLKTRKSYALRQLSEKPAKAGFFMPGRYG